MLLPIPQQAAQAAAALALGALLAALYDFFKAFRLRARRGCLTAAADTLFSAALLASLFAFAQGPGEGRLRLFIAGRGGARLGPLALHALPRGPAGLLRAGGGRRARGEAAEKFPSPQKNCKKYLFKLPIWVYNMEKPPPALRLRQDCQRRAG